ncbi:hypothetical protein CYMTET_30153, partial [Cymbomonas tetramitiformis]
VIRDSGTLVSPPTGYKLAWRSGDCTGRPGVLAWQPVAPEGFVAVGCVVSAAAMGEAPPPLDAVRCVRRELVMRGVPVSCVAWSPAAGSVWQLNNRFGTFLAQRARCPERHDVFQLRLPLGLQAGASPPAAAKSHDALLDDVEPAEPSPGENTLGELTLVQVPVEEECYWSDVDGEERRTSAVSISGRMPDPQMVLWRAETQLPGVAPLGDYVSEKGGPVTRRPKWVYAAVDMGDGAVAHPKGYECIWRSNAGQAVGRSSLWRPVPPLGYLALGHVAARGHHPPPLDLVYCVRESLLAAEYRAVAEDDGMWNSASGGRPKLAAYRRSPLKRRAAVNCWRADATLCTFLAESIGVAHLHVHTLDWSQLHVLPPTQSLPLRISGDRGPIGAGSEKSFLETCTVVDFRLTWWSKDVKSARAVSFWRPVPPMGFFALGDCMRAGYVPPTSLLVCRERGGTALLAAPTGFTQVWADNGRNGRSFSLWRPVAPPGYVALGCLASQGHERPLFSAVRCVRRDLARSLRAEQLEPEARAFCETDASGRLGNRPFSVWPLQQSLCTFAAVGDHQPPPEGLRWSMSTVTATDVATPTGVKPLAEEFMASERVIRMTAAVDDVKLTVADDRGRAEVPLLEVHVQRLNACIQGRSSEVELAGELRACVDSFNQRQQAWEPVLESVPVTLGGSFCGPCNSKGLPPGIHLEVAAKEEMNLVLSQGGLRAMLLAAQGLGGAAGGELPEHPAGTSHFTETVFTNSTGRAVWTKQEVRGRTVVVELPAGGVIRVEPPQASEAELLRGRSTYTAAPTLAISVQHAAGLALAPAAVPYKLVCFFFLPPHGDSTGIPEDLHACHTCTRAVSVTAGRADTTEAPGPSWGETVIIQMHASEPPQSGEAGRALQVVLADVGACGAGVIASGRVLLDQELQQAWIGGGRHTVECVLDCHPGTKELALQSKAALRLELCDMQVLLGDQQRDLKQARISISEHRGAVSMFALSIFSTGPWIPVGRVLGAQRKLAIAAKGVAMVLEPKSAGSAEGTAGVKLVGMHVRAPTEVYNATDLELHLALGDKPGTAEELQRGSGSSMYDVVEEEVLENERYQNLLGFMRSLDKKWPSFSTMSGFHTSMESTELPSGWHWTDTWSVDTTAPGTDADGWWYGADWPELKPPFVKRTCDSSCYVRRRRWTRPRQKMADASVTTPRGALEAGVEVLGTLQPGSRLPLPMKAVFAKKDTLDLHLQPASRSPGPAGGTAGRPAERAFTWSRTPMFSVLQPGVKVLRCFATDGGSQQPVMLCMQSAQQRVTKLNEVLSEPDWTVTLVPPITLENLLPYDATYTVWELQSATKGPCVVQSGTVGSMARVYVYTADVRRSVLLTWSLQVSLQPPRSQPTVNLGEHDAVSTQNVQQPGRAAKLPGSAVSSHVCSLCADSVSIQPPQLVCS